MCFKASVCACAVVVLVVVAIVVFVGYPRQLSFNLVNVTFAPSSSQGTGASASASASSGVQMLVALNVNNANYVDIIIKDLDVNATVAQEPARLIPPAGGQLDLKARQTTALTLTFATSLGTALLPFTVCVLNSDIDVKVQASFIAQVLGLIQRPVSLQQDQQVSCDLPTLRSLFPT
jgi:hypothetical protein